MPKASTNAFPALNRDSKAGVKARWPRSSAVKMNEYGLLLSHPGRETASIASANLSVRGNGNYIDRLQ